MRAAAPLASQPGSVVQCQSVLPFARLRQAPATHARVASKQALFALPFSGKVAANEIRQAVSCCFRVVTSEIQHMKSKITRRKALRIGAAATALPLVHIRTAGAAGKLSLALWDHWVPAGNDAMRKVVAAWADKNKVDVQLDFLTAIGNKINLTMAAEAQAKTGHDIYAFDMWSVHEYADLAGSDG